MDVIATIDQARRRWNVLEHPFYQRWSAGECSAEELALYSGQYRHAVTALARTSELLAEEVSPERRPALERHAAEEASHIALWDEFAKAARAAAGQGLADGPSRAADGVNEGPEAPLDETRRCVQSWTAGEGALERLAVLYAVEGAQPEIARTKLEGLVERYGYAAEGPATEYFRLHSTLDVEHADQARALIEKLLSERSTEAAEGRRDGDPADGPTAIAGRMVERAEAALKANWELLDGVEREFARAS